VDMLQLDLNMSFLPSFALALFVPLMLLAAGVHDFVTVIAVTGAVSLGFEGALALMMEKRAVAAHPRGKIVHIPPLVRTATVTLLIAGIAIELLATFGAV